MWDFFVIFDLYSSEMPKFISYILISLIFLSCNKSENFSIEKVDYRSNTKMRAIFSFPDTVKVGELNLAILTFENSTFDTIIPPRIIDSLKFRWLIFSEFEPINIFDKDFESNSIDSKIFKDSVILDNNQIYIGYEFDNIGIFEIGGLVCDKLIYDYRLIKKDSLQIFNSSGLVSKRVVVIK